MSTKRTAFTVFLAATVVASLLLARHYWFVRAFDRHIQIARSGQIYVDAIFAFHAQHTRFPSSLQELVPGFLNTAPTNDVRTDWDYQPTPIDDRNPGFLLSKHGVLPHTYVQYRSSGMVANVVPTPPVGWVENLEGRITKLNIEPTGATNGRQPLDAETNRPSSAVGSRR